MFARLDVAFLRGIMIASRILAHLPRYKVDNAHDLPLADFHDGKAAATHERAHVVPAQARQFYNVLAIEKTFSELSRKPFYLVRDDLFDINCRIVSVNSQIQITSKSYL